ncbi:MAG: exodeoxyribonuclease VII small subunit [Nitrospirota bacterium]
MGRNKALTYSQALTELEEIVSEIEADDIDVDALAAKVKRAAELIHFCKGRLRDTENAVKKVLTETDAGVAAREPGLEEPGGPVGENGSVDKDLGF